MSAAAESEQHLKELLSKVGHPLVDVRSRSLRSISFKLSNGLVLVEQLANERGFLISLLEWFNFEEWTCESQVLFLLSQLTQHTTAAQIVVEVGGVEFLSQLRLHCDPSLYPLIDTTLEQLLKIPAVGGSLSSTSDISSNTSYEHPEANYNHAGISSTLHSDQSDGTFESPNMPSFHSAALARDTKTGAFPNSRTFEGCLKSSLNSEHSSLSTSDVGSYVDISRESFGLEASRGQVATGLPAQLLQQSSSKGSSPGVSNSSQLSSWTDASLEARGAGFVGGLPYTVSTVIPRPVEDGCEETKREVFQWLPLSDNDRGMLLTTQSRLQSSTEGEQCLTRTSKFIQSVLFQDFPAEVFIQRPALIKTLLRLLEQSELSGTHLPSLLDCLAVYTRTLCNRVAAAHLGLSAIIRDDSLTSGSTSAHSTITTNHTLNTIERLTPEMLTQLQSESLSIPQFSLLVINTLSSLLPSLLASLGEENTVPSDTTRAVSLCVDSLSTIVWLGEKVKGHWVGKDERIAGREGVVISTPQIEGAVDSLCSSLSHYLSKWRRIASQVEGVCPQLHIVCSVTVHLTQALCYIMELDETSSVVPLPNVLSGVMMNGVLGLVCPSLLDTLLPTFERVDAPTARLFHQVRAMTVSFRHIKSFLAYSPSPQSEDSALSQALDLASAGLEGLWFTVSHQFIQKAMELSLKILSDYVPDSSLWDSAKGLVLRLVGHGSTSVREEAYKHLRVHYETWLVSIGEGTNTPTHPLLDFDLLTDICCHGAVAKEEAISIPACKIISSLLSITNEEVAMGDSGVLCKSVQQVLEDKWAGLDDITRLTVCTRLLYSANTELRLWAFRQVTVLLLASQSPPSWSHSTATPLHDVLTLGQQHSGGLNTTQSSFQYEDVSKLIRILRSPGMDESLKKSALDQMAIILRDGHLHKQVLQDDIADDLFSALVSHSTPHNEAPKSLVKPCVKCLLMLSFSGPKLKERVSGDINVLTAILRAVLFFVEDTDFLSCSSMLLATCLFSPVVKVTDDGNVQLPDIFVDRLKFPFLVGKYQLEECHFTPSPLNPKLFPSEPLLSMLRLNYHSAMIGPVEAIITAHENNTICMKDGKMAVPLSDIVSLCSLSVPRMLKEYFDRLKVASTHSEVAGVLQCIVLVLRGWAVYGGAVDLDKLQCGWKDAFQRFLTVSPSSSEDLTLLSTVLKVLQTLTLVSQTRPHQPALPDYLLKREGLKWLCVTICGSESMCMKWMSGFVERMIQKIQADPHRSVFEDLLALFAGLLQCSSTLTQSAWTELSQTLCQCVEVTGTPDHYDIPLLGAALRCLLRLSTSVSEKSLKHEKARQLIVRMMTSLRKVLWSFISGRGLMTSSFLGRGVISQASLTLSHIVQKCSMIEQPEGWWLQWLESSSDIGLSWLQHLIDDREPQTCYAGLSLLATLCAQPELIESLLGVWRDSPSGLWGVCLKISLNPICSDLVRQQALLVLVSVSRVCIEQQKWSNYLTSQVTSLEEPMTVEESLQYLLHTCNLCQLVTSTTQQLPQLSEELSSLKLPISNTCGSSDILASPSRTKSSEETNRNQPITVTFEKNQSCFDFDSNSSQASKAEVDKVLPLMDKLFSCCSPLFVSGVCQLLHNLVIGCPQVVGSYLEEAGTLQSLVRLMDVTVLKLVLQSTRICLIRPPLLVSWVRMLSDVLGLFKALLHVQYTLVHPLFTPGLVDRLCGLLSTVSNMAIEDEDCLCLCSQVLEVLMTVATVQDYTQSVEMTKLVFRALQRHWSGFTKLFLASLRRSTLSTLRTHTLKTLSLLLVYSSTAPCEVGVALEDSASGLAGSDLSQLLDKKGAAQSEQPPSHPDGWLLCAAILEARDQVWTDLTTHTTLTEALKLLLACSGSAKQAALINGLLESALDQLKSLGAKVKSEQNDHQSHGSKKTVKDSPSVLQYISNSHLLRNFMCGSLEVKSAVADSQLLVILLKQWCWYSLNRKVLLAVLKLLCVFTARHPRGQTLLSQPLRCPQSSPPLLHSSFKLCSSLLASNRRLSPAELMVVGGLLQLVANCALSVEGRGLIRKVNPLSHLSSLTLKPDKGQRSTPSKLVAHWVSILTNLSFSSDGQQMIIKQPGSLEILTDVYWSSTGSVRSKSMLTLRNLCFYGPSKPLLVSSEHLQSILTHCLKSEDDTLISLATSAIWALSHNCMKIRNTLRRTELVESLEMLHTKSVAACKLKGSQTLISLKVSDKSS